MNTKEKGLKIIKEFQSIESQNSPFVRRGESVFVAKNQNSAFDNIYLEL